MIVKFDQVKSKKTPKPISFIVEGKSIIQCLAKIEEEIGKRGEFKPLTDDPSFNLKECVAAVCRGESYCHHVIGVISQVLI